MKKPIAIYFSAAFLAASMFSPLCSQAGPRSEYWHQRVSLFDSIPVEHDDIVFLGNSITDGGEFAELFGNDKIKNRGINSDVISGVMERSHQVTRNKPAKIFLLIGINDVSHGLSVETLVSRYEALVEKLRKEAPETRLFIQSVMPVNNAFGRYKNLKGKESVIRELNSRIKDIAGSHGAVYIDLWPALADGPEGNLKREFTNDGLHLLGAGYEAWAECLRPYVEE